MEKKLLFIQKDQKIQKKEDWYRFDLSTYPKIKQLLILIHSDQYFEIKSFQSRTKKSIQRLIFIKLNEIYENNNLIIEDYDHPSIRNNLTNLELELDFFLPSLNMGIEYQGEQHYDDMCSNGFTQIEFYKSRDLQKESLCHSLHISFYKIPYWWDRSIDSLKSILQS